MRLGRASSGLPDLDARRRSCPARGGSCRLAAPSPHKSASLMRRHIAPRSAPRSTSSAVSASSPSGPPGLGHVGAPAAALAAHGLRALTHQIDGAQAAGQIVGDAHQQAPPCPSFTATKAQRPSRCVSWPRPITLRRSLAGRPSRVSARNETAIRDGSTRARPPPPPPMASCAWASANFAFERFAFVEKAVNPLSKLERARL